MSGRLLKLLRLALSILVAGVVTASAAGLALWAGPFAGWIAHVQIFGAVAAFSITVFVSWLLITLVFGRVYCSTVCPLGTLQDLFARLWRLGPARRKARGYRWVRAVPLLQYAVLVIVLVAMMAGAGVVAAVFDPYTVYTGMVDHLLEPLLGLGGARVVAYSATGCAVSGLLLVIISAVSALMGRRLCNTVCPIGTTLGFVSRYAIMQVDIDTDKCTHCGRCESVCKASCINLVENTVDGARCVDCFDCLTVCPNDAIHYTGRRKQLSDVMMQRVENTGRRRGAATATCGPAESMADPLAGNEKGEKTK